MNKWKDKKFRLLMITNIVSFIFLLAMMGLIMVLFYGLKGLIGLGMVIIAICIVGMILWKENEKI